MTRKIPAGDSGESRHRSSARDRFVVGLDDPNATLTRVGGKGASLARLAQAELPVPPGFCVTTSAYDTFVAGNGLQNRIMTAAAAAVSSEPVSCQRAADEIARLIARQAIPAEISAEIAASYRALGGGPPSVAVRSSATAEDLPDLSFAGQQNSYLNVRGEAEVLDAVQDCWASLWTARAIDYRSRNSIAADLVSCGVVVQVLVPANAAGVMFTADPVSGRTDRVVINAAWGLGEAVVGGHVTPDKVVIDKTGGAVITSEINDKTVRTSLGCVGTYEEPVPDEQRRRAVLTANEAADLARLGVRIESLYGNPVDIEWAQAEGRFAILQARPITSAVTATASGSGGRDPWNDSLLIDALWTRGNIGEAVPDVVTPCSRSLLNIVFADMMPTLYLGGYRPVGYIGGRLYLNLSVLMTMLAALGQSRRRLLEATGDLFGQVPDDVEIPVLPVSRWTVITTVIPAVVANRRRIRRNAKRLDAFLASAAARCERLLDQVRSAPTGTDLITIWHEDLLPFLHDSNYMLEAGSKRDGAAFITIRSTLRRLVGEADTNALLLAADDNRRLASLGSLHGLDQLMRGEIERAEFVRRYGHHSAHLFEISCPRPGEDPAWIDAQIAALRGAGVDLAARLAQQRAARQEAWGRFRHRYPHRARAMRLRLARAQQTTQLREAARSEQARAFWPLRAFILRAGELTGGGEDLFYLSITEVLALLGGEESVLEHVPGRRAAHARYAMLPSYPALIRGRFDPFSWAADPQRRSDVYVPGGDRVMAAATDTLRGSAGSPGVMEGFARVLPSIDKGENLEPGEILVTTVTNVGWTPLFPRAGGIVTDVGAALSHAAIVARELGIPAVVGCGDATMRVHDGDWLRIDGAAGTVEILRRDPPGGRHDQ